ncbi:MAG: glycosyltransferase [Chthoniobacterales bacterium]
MREEVVIITPELAPGSGGLADYTRQFVKEWQGMFDVKFLLPSSSGCPTEQSMGNNPAALLRKLPARGGKVLLQYSAYGFDRWGYPRGLLRTLVAWKRASGGRLVVMLHETWAFWPWWNKNYPLQQLHRRALGRLLRIADAVFTTTTKQATQLRDLHPQSEPEVMPVGANISPAPGALIPREIGCAVVLGRQVARVRTLRAMQAELTALAAAGCITQLITVGIGDISDGVERALLAGLGLRDGFVQEGPRSAEEISALLLRASFGISELDRDNVPKSGVFMIFAAHGLNVLSPCAGRAEEAPLCWATQPNELREGLDAVELARRSAQLRAWQEQVGSWSQIARRFATALGLDEAACHIR